MPDLFSTSISPSAKKLLQEKVFGVLPPSIDQSSPLGNVYGYDPQEKLELPQDTNLKWFMDKQAERERLSKSSYGLGISPELETIVNTLRNPVDTALDVGLTKLSQANLPGIGEVNTSMIPTRANLMKFLSNLKGSAKYLPPAVWRDHPEAAASVIFAAERYPLQTQQAFTKGKVNITSPDMSGSTGGFSPKSKRIYIYNPTVKDPNKLPTPANFTGRAGTAMHEYTHLRQLLDAENRPEIARYPIEAFYTPDELGGKGTYVTSQAAQLKGNPNLYFEQPMEKDAFQATKTGKSSAEKFLDLLPDANMHSFMGTPETLSHEKELVSSAFNRAIKEIQKINPNNLGKIYASILKDNKKSTLNKLDKYQYPAEDFDSYFPKHAVNPGQLGKVVEFKGSGLDKVNDALKTRIGLEAPTENQVKLQSLIRLLQDSAKSGPRQNWMKKTIELERQAELEKIRKESDVLRQAEWGEMFDKYFKPE